MNALNKIILGQPQRFEIEDRYFLQTAESAMRDDIARGLVELITNGDDSYGELERNGLTTSGKILIEIERRRKNKTTTVKVSDKAEGMRLEEMVNKLRRVGGITSHFLEAKGVKTRGLMGRGSKECVVFGVLTFKSIKDNVYSEVVLKKPATFVPIAERGVTESDRINLNIPRGNGTVVELEIEPRFHIPSHKFLLENLPKYYSLRDIASSPIRTLELTDGINKKPPRLEYKQKEGSIELDIKFVIPGYPDAEAHLLVKKGDVIIEVNNNSPYWEGGILIQSSYAIHGITGFSREIENNPYFNKYFGRLSCSYIDKLAIEYEVNEKNRQQQQANNPSRIIDPLRKEGLSPSHPFVKSLYTEAARQLRILLKRDEEEATNKNKEVENKKTTNKLRRLADEVSKFIREKTENSESIDDDYYLSYKDIPSGGMIVIPGGLKIPLGEARKIYVYVKPALTQKSKKVLITSSSKSISLSSSSEILIEKEEGVFYTSFSLRGEEYDNNAGVTISWEDLKKYISTPVVKKDEVHPDVEDFSFEKGEYNVREGKQKEIYIFAKWPDFIHGFAQCTVIIDKNENLELLGQNIRLRYKRFEDGTQIAIGKVKVYGKKAGGPILLKTLLKNKEIVTKINVLPPKELGHNIEIKLVDEEALGEQRAVWTGDVLKINTRNQTIRRYSGPPPNYLGQDTIHFHLLLAELIADNVARRILELNAEKNAHKYEEMDIYGFYDTHRKYVNDFLAIAHKIQIPDSELTI